MNLLFSFFLFLLIFFTYKHSLSQECNTLKSIEQTLNQMGQYLIWQGINNNNTSLNRLYMHVDGTWTVLRLLPTGNACIVGSGVFSELYTLKEGNTL